MYPIRLILSILICVFLLSTLPAAAPPPGSGPKPAEIARWVAELGDDSFAVREAASKKLRAAGARAEAMLEKAVLSKDAEVVKRAKSILADFQWGIYLDTPENIVRLIRQYQASARGEKRAVIQKLIASGPAGCRALVKIARAEDDPLVRKDVFADVASGLTRGSGQMLEEGNLAGLEALLQLAVEGDVRSGAPHFAAYHLLTGGLPKRIEELETRAKNNPPGKVEAEILSYLYRARGDLAKAEQAAADAELNELREGILYQKADWKTLAKHPELTDTKLWLRYVGFRAAYTRLAGNAAGYESAIKDIVERARPLAEQKENVLPFAKALFLNARPTEALELLEKSGSEPRLRFEILAVQLRFKAAFAVVEAARAAKSQDLPALEIAQARVLYDLGEKERAFAICDRYANLIKTGMIGRDWSVALVEAEQYLGRYEEAIAVASKILEVSEDPFLPASVMEKLFPENEDEALYLWDALLRLVPKQPFGKILPRIQSLLSGKASPSEVETLIADFNKLPKDYRVRPGPPVPARRRLEWLAAGEAARLCKQDARAEECFRKAGGVRGGILRGDLLAAKKQWIHAAAQYLEAYRLGIKGPDDAETGKSLEEFASLPPLALYLRGDALVKSGQTREGNKCIDRAHLLPLGSGEARYYFAKALMQRGHTVAARREYDLLRRVGEPILIDPEAFFTGEGLRYGAIESASRGDYLKAADGYEQAFLRCLHPEMSFHRRVAYVTVPAQIHQIRALGLAKAGKLDEAKTQALRALAAMPGSVDVALKLAPIFNEHKRSKDADEFFASIMQVYEAVIRDYPQYTGAYNQAAWMSACCRRKLDKGLVYARKAVALSPKTAAYHDTLAEVLFQQGKKDEAVAEQKRAIALDPKRAYFRKQLKRIESGDPRAARPEEDD